MRGTVFYKMSGSGNDFVVLDGRSTQADLWPAERIRALCDRRSGVGGDGFVILTPAAPGSVRMAYWNADGSHGALCGNAALCCSRLAVTLELVEPREFCLLTDSGVVQVSSPSQGELAQVNLPDVELPRDQRSVTSGRREHWACFGAVGVPHLVLRVDDVNTVDVAERGRHLRSHASLGSEGANVNFVSPSAETWLIRTYERGVEGETLACGTGTVAAALALVAKGEASLPLRFRSRGGPELTVQADVAGARARNVWLGGQGRLVFRGVWEDI
jgi:diaminopimelate epimerase